MRHDAKSWILASASKKPETQSKNLQRPSPSPLCISQLLARGTSGVEGWRKNLRMSPRMRDSDTNHGTLAKESNMRNLRLDSPSSRLRGFATWANMVSKRAYDHPAFSNLEFNMLWSQRMLSTGQSWRHRPTAPEMPGHANSAMARRLSRRSYSGCRNDTIWSSLSGPCASSLFPLRSGTEEPVCHAPQTAPGNIRAPCQPSTAWPCPASRRNFRRPGSRSGLQGWAQVSKE